VGGVTFACTGALDHPSRYYGRSSEIEAIESGAKALKSDPATFQVELT
jgi:hypothetical protein